MTDPVRNAIDKAIASGRVFDLGSGIGLVDVQMVATKLRQIDLRITTAKGELLHSTLDPVGRTVVVHGKGGK